MNKLNQQEQKNKTILIVLCVVFIGLSLFNIGLWFLSRDARNLGACKVCTNLNPYLERCIYPLDYNPYAMPPFISYGKQNLSNP